MSGSLALIEPLLVLAGVLCWGSYELRGIKRAKREAEKERRGD